MTELSKGGNAPLAATDLVLTVDVAAPADLSALLVTESGKVRTDADFIFYNQPTGPGVRCVPGGGGQGWRVEVDLNAVPADIHAVRLVTSLDGDGLRFGGFPPPVAHVRGRGGEALIDFPISGLDTESILVALELYRRQGAWKVRAVGQGYAGGLADLITDHGVSVDDAPATPPQPAPAAAPPPPPPPSAPPAPPSPSAPAPGFPSPPAPGYGQPQAPSFGQPQGPPPQAPGYGQPPQPPGYGQPPQGPPPQPPGYGQPPQPPAQAPGYGQPPQPPGYGQPAPAYGAPPAFQPPPVPQPGQSSPGRPSPGQPPSGTGQGEVQLTKNRPVSLSKGQKVTLKKDQGVKLTLIRMGLGWDPIRRGGLFGRREVEIDLDASAVLMAGADLVDIAFYNNLRTKDGSIQHLGDNRTGEGEGDDEVILVDLTRVPVHVTTIVFTVTSYEGQTFENIVNAFVRLVDHTTGVELARFALQGGMPYTGLLMAKVYRAGDDWKLEALGEPMQARNPSEMLPHVIQACGGSGGGGLTKK